MLDTNKIKRIYFFNHTYNLEAISGWVVSKILKQILAYVSGVLMGKTRAAIYRALLDNNETS